MKNFLIILVLLAQTSIISLGQAVENSTPAPTNINQNQCPCIMPDNSVIFQIKAPNASKIQIDLGKKYDMVKDANGLWTVRMSL